MVHFHDKLLVKKQPLVHSVGIGPKLVLLTKTRVSNKKKDVLLVFHTRCISSYGSLAVLHGYWKKHCPLLSFPIKKKEKREFQELHGN